MCLAQGHNAVTPMRLEPATPWSRVKHSTTEPLHSLTIIGNRICLFLSINLNCHYHHENWEKISSDLPNCKASL